MDQLGERMTWNRLPMVFQKRVVAMGGQSLQKTNAESAVVFVWKRARGRASGLSRSGRQWWVWKFSKRLRTTEIYGRPRTQ